MFYDVPVFVIHLSFSMSLILYIYIYICFLRSDTPPTCLVFSVLVQICFPKVPPSWQWGLPMPCSGAAGAKCNHLCAAHGSPSLILHRRLQPHCQHVFTCTQWRAVYHVRNWKTVLQFAFNNAYFSILRHIGSILTYCNEVIQFMHAENLTCVTCVCYASKYLYIFYISTAERIRQQKKDN